MSRLLVTKRLILTTVAAAFAALLPSCMVGPNFKSPQMGMPATFKSPPATQPTPALTRDWWRLFNDPQLTTLEEAATTANPDVQAAVARVTQARAAARATFADLYPTLDFSPSIDRSRSPLNNSANRNITGSNVLTNRSSARTATSVRIPFDLSYELDIWGRVRRGIEAAQAQVRASESDYQVILQTLQADVATTYFAIRGLDLQERILERTVESYRKQVELTQKQLKAGIVGQTTAAQVNAELASTTTQLIDIRRQRADSEHALAILTGRTPSELNVAIHPLDMTPPAIPAGLPADLLRRRPDVAVAEQNLIAANANVGVAIANFYPRLTLSGSAGFESFDVRHAIDWEQRIWSLGAGLTLPIFEGGRLNANLEQSRARYAELLANYRSTVLGAVRDVEDALVDIHLRADAAAAQDQAVAASREYLRLSEVLNQQGVIGYLQVIDAQRTLLSNEVTAAQILNQRLASTVLLIKAVGGGWTNEPTPPAP